jgi:uncharacterized protein (DUF2235 family)
MAMKRIVVCCDGTWNNSDDGTGYTNVSRLAWSIKPIDANGIAQIVFYQSGVGGAGSQFDKIAAGALGLGLSRNMRDAYAFICNNYCEGDEIFLFGFSRGAYTARCISGLIGFAGLIGKRDLDRFMELWKAYKERDTAALASFETRKKDASIKCVGVWDTVGSVGIPSDLAKLDVFFKKYYGFFDTDLGLHIEHAFHAIALDERRRNFVPTLWTQTPEGKAKGQTLKQVWFAGVHSDVGGGYPEHGASDIPLAWMASEVSPYLDLDFDYLKMRRDISSKWALAPLHESFTGFWSYLPGGQAARTPFSADQASSFEKVHASVAARSRAGGLGADGNPYGSKALRDGDLSKYNVDLSPLENGLKWADADVKPALPAAKQAKSFVDFFAKGLGVTS